MTLPGDVFTMADQLFEATKTKPLCNRKEKRGNINISYTNFILDYVIKQ
jgi:hypothetical protein